MKKTWLGLSLGLVAVMLAVLATGCATVENNPTPSYTTGTVSGVVANAAGTPISGATVNTFNGSSILTATTNASGAYTLSGVWNGVHVLLISSDNYYAINSVAVTANTTTSQNVSADAGTAATAVPVVTLTSVGTQTASEFFTVAGSVTPVGEVNNVVISVNNNDSLASAVTGTFMKVVNLVSGTNAIVVTAFNSKGYNQKTITVTYTPPAVQTGAVKITLNWDKASDMDLHLWNSAGDRHTYYGRHYGGPLATIEVSYVDSSGIAQTTNYYGDTTLAVPSLSNTLLDYDNIGGTGPENMTIFADGLTAAGRYLVAVNSYSASWEVTCSISVKLPDGTTQAYTQVITTSSGRSGNPNTDTASWWRPFDIVVSSSGAVSIATTDLTGTLNTASVRSSNAETKKKVASGEVQ